MTPGNVTPLMKTELNNLDDGSVKVCIEKDNFRVCGFVSSQHLVEPKVNQLLSLLNGDTVTVDLEDEDELAA